MAILLDGRILHGGKKIEGFNQLINQNRFLYCTRAANQKSEHSEMYSKVAHAVRVKMALLNKREPIAISEKDQKAHNIPKAYIDKLNAPQNKVDGIINLQALFLDLFKEYSKKGPHFLAHSKPKRADIVYDVVLQAIENKQSIDWNGVLKALETWPDGQTLEAQGTLKKRVEFFRLVVEKVDAQKLKAVEDLHLESLEDVDLEKEALEKPALLIN